MTEDYKVWQSTHLADSPSIYKKISQTLNEVKNVKHAFKGYVIEQDKDGNETKILHEDIVFAADAEKAKQAILIRATQGGVINADTNFVVVAGQLGNKA